ncbi:rho guanine nucleotide exchange factor 2 isoform d [Holotrichia oblita]|uniref:Rho guanine nucleotide exchange factor 2 isoform d n=1 Tax=Holotrichia oblita TaxID=644536 RepID=A0ACB9TVZ4_HOLOL|nr:rho guanine nucleotide exchange factor 2 isoform d [Holotrichia oblita]
MGGHRMGSPSLHNRPVTTHSPARITGPQPVNDEKLFQLQLEREQHFRLMIEKEERYLEALRSQLARSPDEKKFLELEKAERNLQKLQGMLQNHVRNQSEQTPPFTYPVDNKETPPPLPRTPPPNFLPPKTKKLKSFFNANESIPSTTEVPPPLPKRNRTGTPATLVDVQNNQYNAQYVNGKVHSQLFLNNELNLILRDKENNTKHIANTSDIRVRSYSLDRKKRIADDSEVMVDNALYSDFTIPDPSIPPPLPPRTFSNSKSSGSDPDAANSINKQLSYPLVATCATLVNNYSPNHTHHRTKSSPESLLLLSPSEASKRLIASESMSDMRPLHYDTTATPPGTPPPPYPSPVTCRKLPDNSRSSANTEEVDIPCDETPVEYSSPDISPLRGSGPSPALIRVLANSSPIHAANPQTTQQSIMSMEDDEISDQEIVRSVRICTILGVQCSTSSISFQNQLEDHGPFRSLALLWDHTPHLAVFMNYVLLNSDPNSLLFYLLTNLYKEGNVKEMKKWAYEIHSSFLVPGAPLHLSNVEENIAHEIDDVLTREHDKEEIMRKIFRKARNKAREELTKQLSDFQQKRTAGLGTMYGPPDSILAEVNADKAREQKFYETLLLDKLDPYL